MNKKTAKLIKKLSRITSKGEKSLKREYYNLSSKERRQMKKELEMVIANPELAKGLEEEVVVDKKEVVGPSMGPLLTTAARKVLEPYIASKRTEAIPPSEMNKKDEGEV